MARRKRKKFPSLRAETRAEIQTMAVDTGICTPSEADETADFMDKLADRELSGELTPKQAMAELVAFSIHQLIKRGNR